MSEIPKTGTLNIPTEHAGHADAVGTRPGQALRQRDGDRRADFDLYPGEILAVIGDNGAGKSSMIKALSGAVVPDQGQISLDGQPVHFKSPLEARRAGIETVYQDLAVAPALDIATNLFLGREAAGRAKRQRQAGEEGGPAAHGRPQDRPALHEPGRRRSRAVSARASPWHARPRGPASS